MNFFRLLTLNQERGMDYCYHLTRGVLQGIFRERKQEAMQALSQLQSLTHLNINIKSGVGFSCIQQSWSRLFAWCSAFPAICSFLASIWLCFTINIFIGSMKCFRSWLVKGPLVRKSQYKWAYPSFMLKILGTTLKIGEG